MPEPDRLKSLMGRGRRAATEEPPAGSTPKGLFLRKLRPGGTSQGASNVSPVAMDATTEKVVQQYGTEQQPVGKESDVVKSADISHPTLEVKAKKPPPFTLAGDSPYLGKHPGWPLVILRQLHKDFEWKWVDWEPEALWDAIGQHPPDVVKDIIGALRGLLSSESFWHEFHIFLWACQAFNGRRVDFRLIPELEPHEIMYGVFVAQQIRDEHGMKFEDQKIPGVSYGPEVLATIAAAFRVHGMLYVPPPVEGATSLLLDSIDSSMHELAAEVKSAWPETATNKAKARVEETPLGVQIARLIEIREYAKDVSDA